MPANSLRIERGFRDAQRVRQGLAERVIAAGRDGFANGYVFLVRRARRLAHTIGLLDTLDRRRDRRGALFLRSLFAVHDVQDLGQLDLPWWTIGTIDRIDAFLRSRGGEARAFEYGGGASTLWLARRCNRVVTVEHDEAWWRVLSAHLEDCPNVRAWHIPPVAASTPTCPSERAGWSGYDFSYYVRAIRKAGGPFDLIVIDGRARPSCLREAVKHLLPGGLVVLDNSSRRRYGRAITESGMKCERVRGFAPAVPWPSQTALLARDRAVIRDTKGRDMKVQGR